VLWELMALASLLLVLAEHRERASVRQAAVWYAVMTHLGLVLMLVGFAVFAAQAGGETFAALRAGAQSVSPTLRGLVFVLVAAAFTSKAGAVPLHAWLPRAHPEAPSPVSALMSAAMVNLGIYGLVRTGLDLIALAAAIGSPLALSAALLHIAGHGLANSVAFCASGRILQLTGTAKIGRVRGLPAQAPASAGAFGFAVVALMAFPPFSLFASELGIARAGFAAGAGLGWATATALLLVLVAFAALAARTARMLLGPGTPTERSSPSAVWPLLLGLAACAALGVATGPLTDLLHGATQAIGG